jgi:hypothetical protein
MDGEPGRIGSSERLIVSLCVASGAASVAVIEPRRTTYPLYRLTNPGEQFCGVSRTRNQQLLADSDLQRINRRTS